VHAFALKFTDQFGRKYVPGVLIEKAGSGIDPEARLAFKNILAIASIPLGFAKVLEYGSQFEHLRFSEYFLPYPYSLTLTPRTIGKSLPTGWNVDSLGKFRGQSSPDLSFPREIGDDKLDLELLRYLFSEWEKFFIHGKKTSRLRRLFRSLEMSFRAASAPIQNRATVDDIGTQLALWASAFEILTHPGRLGRVDVLSVLNLLGKADVQDREISRRRYKIKVKGVLQKVGILKKLYFSVHSARNEYLHGNPRRKGALFAFGDKNRDLLNYLVPILYRFALSAELRMKYPDREVSLEDWHLRGIYEGAILKSRGIR